MRGFDLLQFYPLVSHFTTFLCSYDVSLLCTECDFAICASLVVTVLNTTVVALVVTIKLLLSRHMCGAFCVFAHCALVAFVSLCVLRL